MHNEPLTEEKLKTFTELWNADKIMLMRKMPWKCIKCKQNTCTQLEWINESDCFKVTCTNCGEVNYS